MKIRKILSLLLVAALIMASFTACKEEDTEAGERSEWDDIAEDNNPYPDLEAHSFSKGIDEDGYWESINALGLIEMFTYKGIEIPEDIHKIDDDDIEDKIYELLVYGNPEDLESLTRITDREVEDGDKVNIDYVGSIDGEEFSGGNSRAGDNEDGWFVTAGSDEFIGDFLTQIIGHSPGETIDVIVTFPEDYGNEDLDGKEALFVVDINYIMDKDELDALARTELQRDLIANYAIDLMLGEETTTITVPDDFMEFIEKCGLYGIERWNDSAIEQEMSLNEYIATVMQIEGGVIGVLETYRESNIEIARIGIVLQAIAEDLEMKVTQDEIVRYLGKIGYTSADLDELSDLYGMPYLKQATMQNAVVEYIVDNAKLL